MADNNFNPNNDLGQFYQRSNKLANSSNSLKLKVERQYCDSLELVGDFVVDSGANTVTFTAGSPTSAYDVRYFQIFIQDESGACASKTATGTELAAPIVVDTTALDVNSNWFITVYFSNDKEVVLECDCKTFGEIKVVAPSSDPTVSVNTVLLDAAVIAVFEADGVTAVPNDGADFDLGSFPALGTTEEVSVVFKNTGGAVLEITAVNTSGEIDSLVTAVPNYVYVADSLEFKFIIDTSGAAGVQSIALEVFTNDTTNSPFIVNAAFTLV